MLKWITQLFDSNSTVSSARFLNIYGGLMFGFVYIADFVLNKKMNIDATGLLALYYAGVYGTSGVISWAKGKFDVGK